MERCRPDGEGGGVVDEHRAVEVSQVVVSKSCSVLEAKDGRVRGEEGVKSVRIVKYNGVEWNNHFDVGEDRVDANNTAWRQLPVHLRRKRRKKMNGEGR